MINKLRRNFILISIASMAIVLSVIVGAINLISYHNITTKADYILSFLVDNSAYFPEDIPTGNNFMTEETPYETRYFAVIFDNDGEIVSVDTENIATIDTDEAIEYAAEVYSKSKSKGYYGNYRYLVDDDTVIFVDVTRDLNSFHTLLTTSISLSLVGIIAVLILVIIFSKKVFKTVAESYDKQKQFITDASHELKTPLAIINADVEVLELEYDESQWTKSMKGQINRLSLLIEQMLSLARLEENQEIDNKTAFSLSQVLTDIIDQFDPLIMQNNKVLETKIEEVEYQGDEKLIRQMISLLLDNAIKYSSEYGHIYIELTSKSKKCQLIMKNDVEEIQKGNLDILFERFYRMDSSHDSKSGGSGVGLSIVKAVVDKHKGKISARSDDGKSIVFTITL